LDCAHAYEKPIDITARRIVDNPDSLIGNLLHSDLDIAIEIIKKSPFIKKGMLKKYGLV